MTPDPRTLYKQRLEERRAAIAHRELRHRMLGRGKLATAAFGVALVWIALAQGAFSILWVLIPIAGFALLVVVHEKLLKELERRRRAARFFEKALARLDGNWAGTGEPGDRYLDAAHPYAVDLDLFGKGSVFELLSTARTRIGEDRLARWLILPAPPEEVRARQQAVDELRARVDLREELAVVAEEARTGVDPVRLAPGAKRRGAAAGRFPYAGPPAHGAGSGRLCGSMDSPDSFGKPAGFERGLGCPGARPVPGGPGGQRLVLVPEQRRLGATVSAVEEAAHELGLLSEVLVRLEREHFRSPLLAGLRASLDAEGEPPSRQLARLKRLMEYLDSRDNVVVRVLEPFILWTPHLALQVEDWRRAFGHGGAALADGGGRNRGAVLAGQPRLRASGRSVSRSSWPAGRVSRPKASAIR